MARLKKCPICKQQHRLKKQYLKCKKRAERAKAKPCKVCGVKHRKKSAANRCARKSQKLSW